MPVKTRYSSSAAVENTRGARYGELKRMLIERQHAILNEVQDKMRTVRAEDLERDHEVLKQGGDINIQQDIELTLIHMKAETLKRINSALLRLENGTYGQCIECAAEIAHPRLSAIPFAVRCKDCEEIREVAHQRERIQARSGRLASLRHEGLSEL